MGENARFSRKLGKLGVKTLKSIPYILSNGGRKGDKNACGLQLANHLKMASVSQFVVIKNEAGNIGYKGLPLGKTANNCANSYIRLNVLVCTYPNFSIGPKKLLMGNGSLPTAVTPTASLIAVSVVTFHRVNNISNSVTKASGKAFMVVYCAQTVS